MILSPSGSDAGSNGYVSGSALGSKAWSILPGKRNYRTEDLKNLFETLEHPRRGNVYLCWRSKGSGVKRL